MSHSSSYRLAAKVLVSSIFICLAAPLVAQNDNPTGKSGVFNGNSDMGASYDPYTANATRTIVDLSVPGAVGNYPLQWIRTMNSRRTEGHGFDFGSGAAWQHSYAWSIDIGPRTRAEQFVPVPKSYIVYYPDGRRVDFQRRQSAPVDNAWRGPTGTTDRFQPVAGTGTCILLLSDGGQVEFSQVGTFDEVVGWEFELSGPTRIIDPHGQATTFSYTNDLTQITEPAGRWLRISYTNPFGLQVIGGVQAGYGSNTVIQSVSYSYQQFSISGFNYTTLTGASYSDGTSAAYTYQSSNTYPNTGAPLIQTCDDVRHPGPMKKIAYEFIAEPSEANGGIYGEFGIARKWLWPAPSVVSYWLGGHTETRGDGPLRTFHYGSAVPLQTKPLPYLLSSYTDFKGKLTSFGYDANTYLNSVTDANGNTTTFTKTPLTGKILTITHPPDETGVSSTRQYFYTNQNTAYYLDHVIDELGHRTGYQRDDKFRIKTINYPDTATEEFTYNNFGRVMTRKMTSGGIEGFEYDSRGRLLRYRDPYHDPINKTGKPTAWYQYNSLDRVSGVTEWRGTGPGDLNYTTNYEYNQRGQPTKRIHPIDSVTGARYSAENTYNNDSTLATVTDERGSTTTYGYDDYKRLSSITAPIAFVGDTTPRVTYLYYNRDGTATIDYRFTASAVGNVTSPLGNTVKTLYDNDLWKCAVIIGTGVEAGTTSYTYDNVGSLKTVKDPHWGQQTGVRTEYFYDKRNRLIHVNDPVWSNRNSLNHTVSWTYDQVGNKKSQQRANNQMTTYDVYDAMNRLQVQSVQHEANVTDRTVMTYDLAGNLATFTDARQKVYTYVHDLLNRRTSVTYPKDEAGTVRSEAYHYDLSNNMDSYTNRAGAVQTFIYDNRNRNTYFSWSDGSNPRYTSYDPAGNILNLHIYPDGGDSIDFAYDFRNRKTSETQMSGGIGVPWTVRYTYDADSNRKTITYPSGSVFTYNHNSRDQVASILESGLQIVDYYYDLSGIRRARYLRNGTHTVTEFNAVSMPVASEHRRLGATWARFIYRYDSVSRVKWVERDSSRGDAYDYYLDDQLKTVEFDALNVDTAPTGAANSTSLVYDASGNRTSQTNSTTDDYHYSANDLNQYNLVNSVAPTYDAKGNLTSYDGSVYTYDAQNRLINTSKNGNNVRIWYDALGRQLLRNINGQWIYSVWDGWDLIEEYTETSTLIHAYLHGTIMDEMVKRWDGGAVPNTIWYYQDAQGSTTHLADDSGNVIERYKYDPALSGAPYIYNANGQQISASAFDNRFLYTGRDWIKELGLYDYRNRFYLPALDRFLQPDPIGFSGGDANLYRYCSNNPVNNIDPSGLNVRLWGFGANFGFRAVTSFSAQVGFSYGWRNPMTWTIGYNISYVPGTSVTTFTGGGASALHTMAPDANYISDLGKPGDVSYSSGGGGPPFWIAAPWYSLSADYGYPVGGSPETFTVAHTVGTPTDKLGFNFFTASVTHASGELSFGTIASWIGGLFQSLFSNSPIDSGPPDNNPNRVIVRATPISMGSTFGGGRFSNMHFGAGLYQGVGPQGFGGHPGLGGIGGPFQYGIGGQGFGGVGNNSEGYPPRKKLH